MALFRDFAGIHGKNPKYIPNSRHPFSLDYLDQSRSRTASMNYPSSIFLHSPNLTKHRQLCCYEDFVIKYEFDNRLRFMGNGFLMRDLDGRDATWYSGIVDGENKEPDYVEIRGLRPLTGLVSPGTELYEPGLKSPYF
jgi:hypothetical protein